jgi:hypothetical protein
MPPAAALFVWVVVGCEVDEFLLDRLLVDDGIVVGNVRSGRRRHPQGNVVDPEDVVLKVVFVLCVDHLHVQVLEDDEPARRAVQLVLQRVSWLITTGDVTCVRNFRPVCIVCTNDSPWSVNVHVV